MDDVASTGTLCGAVRWMTWRAQGNYAVDDVASTGTLWVKAPCRAAVHRGSDVRRQQVPGPQGLGGLEFRVQDLGFKVYAAPTRINLSLIVCSWRTSVHTPGSRVSDLGFI